MALLELVMRPIPRTLGIQPYFLGGLGVATWSGFGGVGYVPVDGSTRMEPYSYRAPRQSWAFASAGMGLDVGRAFVQMKLANPIASQGPGLAPVSVG